MTTLYGGSGDDVFHISSESQQTVVVGDTLKSTRASDDGLSNMPVLETTNTNYADVVELDWRILCIRDKFDIRWVPDI